MDIVERLLNDLLSTTGSYKQLQDKENRLVADLSLAQAQLFPLRKENARLSRENHELHLDHIRQNEEGRVEMDKFSKQIRVLSDQITELKLLNRMSDEQIRAKDEVIERLREVSESSAFVSLNYEFV